MDTIPTGLGADIKNRVLSQSQNQTGDIHPLDRDLKLQDIHRDSATDTEVGDSGMSSVSGDDTFAMALRNHNGDTDFLSSLLGDFLTFYSDAGAELEIFINSSTQNEQAIRLAHNLAGVAGSFGATDLLNSARALEKSLVSVDGMEQNHLEQLKEALEIFIQDINHFITRYPVSSAS